jgi:glutamate-1-semialdehyde 2,1-aminomutase
MPNQIDPAKLGALHLREAAHFRTRTPLSTQKHAEARKVMPDGVPMAWMAGLYAHAPMFVAGGQGSRFEDIDGNSYVDFNLADLSNTIGYGANAVSDALAMQAARGIQHLLPSEDAITVATELGHRTGLPFWQFTATASAANTEVIRIARTVTGRDKIVVFEGKYHGHIDATLIEDGAPEGLGIAKTAIRDTICIPFNDPDALARVLAAGDVALVITEPALTNCTLVLPDPGFWETVYTLCQNHGALLCFDETHTWQFAYGGMMRAMGLKADFISLGKGLGTGVPLGCYGMTAPLAAFLEENLDHYGASTRGLAIGGTTYGSALTMAAVRAGLEVIATEAAYARMATLGARLSDGIDAIVARHKLPWRAFRYGPRAGFCLLPDLPRNYQEAQPALYLEQSAARRLFLANRGIWDAIPSAGPQVSFAHSAADIDTYLAVSDEFLAEVVTAS